MLKVGIIGFGKMGKIRAKAIKGNQCGQVVAVYEKNEEEDLENYPAAESPDAIINSPEIDAVFICTPNFLNKELTIKSLQAGKHVFCEKPPAFTAAEVAEIREMEQSSGKKLMYGFNHRHHSSIKYMKSLISGGEYGKVLWMRGRYGKSVDKEFFEGWRSQKDLAGGGILLDQGIHMLDLFLHLGGTFDQVHAFVSNLYWKCDVEDNVFAILKSSESGVVASLHSTMTQWRHLFSLEIFLEKGYMVLNGLKTSSGTYGDEVLSVARNRSTAPAASWEDEDKTTYHSSTFWRSEIDHFMASILDDTPIKIGSSQDALNLMTLLDKIYEAGDK
ncbi:MAG: Gfo/Idh/MocA family oxidoreductase [bacterium]|nr:Gfo/Idh/MocA family oxidoreductase [bacterium]